MKKTIFAAITLLGFILIIGFINKDIPKKEIDTSPVSTSSDKIKNFNMTLPQNWKMTGTVIYDESGKKYAELTPGIVKIKDNEKCFEIKSPEDNNEIISKKETLTNEYKTILEIEKTEAWDGINNDQYWYPHRYCLNNNNGYYLYISFYEYDITKVDLEKHMKILKSISF